MWLDGPHGKFLCWMLERHAMKARSSRMPKLGAAGYRTFSNNRHRSLFASRQACANPCILRSDRDLRDACSLSL